MAEGKRVQSRNVVWWWLILSVAIFFIIGVGFPLTVFTKPPGTNTDEDRKTISQTAWEPVIFWCIGCPIAFVSRQLAFALRAAWTLGLVFFWIHIAAAFHLAHGWSHAAAWEHTRQVGGYGDGIYVNYAFAIAWLADVIWSWVAFDSYFTRPRWMKWPVHGFLAFVVFNAAFVFASWPHRLFFGVCFLTLPGLYPLGMWYVQRRSMEHCAHMNDLPSSQ